MSSSKVLVGGLAIGSGLMYWFDPDAGARRRSRLVELFRHSFALLVRHASKASRDIRHRAHGVVASVRGGAPGQRVDDQVLVARVRAGLGRCCSHARAIDVRASDGLVELSGPILAREVEGVLRAVARVDGVSGVDNRLEVHERAGRVPGLQGSGRRPAARSEILQASWTPALRMLAGLGGLALLTYGARRSGAVGRLAALGGLGLSVRSGANLPLRRLTGLGAGRRAVDVQKTITIDAPVEEVFARFGDLEQLPRFMRHVRQVQRVGPRRYRWTVGGPLGLRFSWEADLTRTEPDRLLAWKSIEGATVQSAGIVHFEPLEGGGTRVHLRMSYDPPGGAIGHAFARLLGGDPKRLLDEDLLRLKSLLEEGKARGRGGAAYLEDLEGARPGRLPSPEHGPR